MAFLCKKRILPFFLAACMIAAIIATVPVFSTSADDPTPENIGVLYTDDKTGIQVSNAVLIEEGGEAITAVPGLGSHGGHETRLVRTEYGTYVAYITGLNLSDTTLGHENWTAGTATFNIIKITSEGSHVIFSFDYPKANGSCTPNVVNAGDGIVYVTILCGNPDRYYETMGTPNFTNSAWVMLFEIDTSSDDVTLAAEAKYDFTTSPFDDHGYGYSQPILDKEHGKLYALYCGGEVPGYLAWFTYDLNTRTWENGCRCVELPARYCYINGYPDGNGGFSIIIERDAPSSEYGAAHGMTFAASGYLFDAEYMIHVPDPTVDHADTTVIWEPNYATGGKNLNAAASHYGEGGCTYLDNLNRLHVIYSVTYYTTPTSKTSKVSGTYHAVYDLSGNELYNELIPTTLLSNNGTKTYKGTKGFVMTQAWDGTYYVFLMVAASTATLDIWSSPAGDGINFKKVKGSLVLKDADGNPIAEGTMPIIANSRNFSVRDGIAAIMFHSNSTVNDGNPYYYFSVKLDEPVPHDHVWTDMVTEPTCEERGFTTHVCSVCGQKTVDTYVDPKGHSFGEWHVVTEPTVNAEGEEQRECSACGGIESRVIPKLTGHVPGDINGDGTVNSKDLTRLLKYLSGDSVTVNVPALDVNGDGAVNSKDLTRLLKYLSGDSVQIF